MGLRGMNLVMILWSRLQRLCTVGGGSWRHDDEETVNNPKELATVAFRGTEEEALASVPCHIYGSPQL